MSAYDRRSPPSRLHERCTIVPGSTRRGEKMLRILVVVAALASAAVVAVSPASAGTTPRYTVSGIETGIPQSAGVDESTSPFAGVGFSWTAGFATWTAHVTHYGLDSSQCGSLTLTGCITGGDFSLSGRRTITGTFASGSIVSISGSAVTCTSTAVYGVTGVVDLNGGGTATFAALLTHYQVKLFGTCVPYFATVSGTFG
jgi:hypothetical protein